ncbi:methylglyoxal synthase-like protein [Rhizophagus irregularis]|uniref:Methylglyoxal synthase-like protein n=1 Tax=Rhizophagus irregularis TaxID=588596 RepID=A0A2N0QIX4_9GLOM|nr:methylglyoxal synthase-like protein [Rhizophagus irregularis]
MIANNDMDMVVFFRDPLTAQPHEPDVTALVRLCDVYHIPLATNMGTAEILLKGLQEGFVDWRLIQERRNVPFRLKKIYPNVFFHEVEVNNYSVFQYPPYDIALASKMADVIKSEELNK